MSKSQRSFVFTYFGEMPEDKVLLDSDMVKYSIYQLEKCPDTGKLHYQGYVELKDKKTFNFMKTLFYDDSVHIEFRKGTAQQAKDYCSKEETRVRGPWENGKFNKVKQGRRTDLELAKEAIDQGMPINELIDSHVNTYARHMKFFKEYYADKNKNVMRDPPIVKVLVGPPGCGKTRYIYDNHSLEDIYELTPGNSRNLWFDGYVNQKILLLDDYYGFISYDVLLKLLDRYRFRGEIKGGHVYINPSHIYITSNKDPSEWYPDIDISALKRRFTEVVYLS